MELLLPDSAPRAAVLVIHSWWGLAPSFRDYGAALAAQGCAVGLSDLFDGRTARTEADARRLRAAPRRTPMYRTLAADIDRLRAAAGASARLCVAGFSMGGHWAVWLAQRPEYGIAAASLYYAARGGDFSNCRAAFIAHFAERDPWVSAAARRRMEAAIRKAGVPYRAFDYPGTGHWFAETDRGADHHAPSARLALRRDLAHFHAAPGA